jgi:hypothetical protein
MIILPGRGGASQVVVRPFLPSFRFEWADEMGFAVLLNPVAVVGSRAFVPERVGIVEARHEIAARYWTCLDFYLLDFPHTHSRIYRSTQPSTDESLRTVCCYDTHINGIKCNRGTNYIFNAARIRRCGCTKQNKVEVMQS